MDAEQKFTLANSYEVDQNFIDKIKGVPISVSLSVAKLIDDCLLNIPHNNDDSQVHGGVVHYKKEAFFFSIEIFYRKDESPYLMDFNLVDSDKYLDLILNNLHLKK